MQRLRSFWKNSDGVASIEFALMFPIVMSLFILGGEVALYQLRLVMFERGVDVVARALRLGDANLNDPDHLKWAVCQASLVIPNCMEDLTLEMGPIPVDSFNFSVGDYDCRDRTLPVEPVVRFQQGQSNEVMLLRFCVLYDPIFATVGLGKIMPRAQGGGVPMLVSTFFVNEP